jgi:glucan phosphoethanolaminetransferase (alkaline phosphatase superfamily)
MIQRPQHLLLALITVLMLVLLAVPIWTKATVDGAMQMRLTAFQLVHLQSADAQNPQNLSVVQQESKWYIGALAIVTAALAAYSISQFKRRKLQRQLGFAITLLLAAIAGAIIFTARQGEAWLNPNQMGSQQIGFYLPVVALIANMISNRLIQRDEALVRSIDRIR